MPVRFLEGGDKGVLRIEGQDQLARYSPPL
jgi:hypothetical protein